MKKYKCTECRGNCMGCFYTDLCDKWLDKSPYEPYFEVSDPNGLQAEAESKLRELDIKSLDLYVTGLTVALVAVLNACHKLGIVVTLYHYDREEGNYYPQQVL